jgi:hypothetical protein
VYLLENIPLAWRGRNIDLIWGINMKKGAKNEKGKIRKKKEEIGKTKVK